MAACAGAPGRPGALRPGRRPPQQPTRRIPRGRSSRRRDGHGRRVQLFRPSQPAWLRTPQAPGRGRPARPWDRRRSCRRRVTLG